MPPLPWLLVLLPWAGAVALAFVARPRAAARLNLGVSGGFFLLALGLLAQPFGRSGWIHVDALNLPLLILGGFVGLTTAAFVAATIEGEDPDPEGLAALGHDPWGIRALHVAWQGFMGAQALALLADSLGVMWIALELATLAAVAMIALHRTPAAVAAAWRVLILGAVGLALALLGTVLLHLAAEPAIGEAEGLSWLALRRVAAGSDPVLLGLAFVLLLLGYGAKAGLVPLHAWPRGTPAGPATAVAALVSGLLANAALHAVLRVKAIVAANPEAIAPGPLLAALGLAALLLGGLALWRRRGARRLLVGSAIGHAGLAAFAFGIGGAAANAAGLLHLLGHTLAQGATGFGLARAAGRAAGAAGIVRGRRAATIGGLVTSHPALGWGLALGIAALAGLPPFALFASEARLLTETVARAPWIAAVLGLGLVLLLAGLVGTLHRLCLGEPTPEAVMPVGGLAEAAVLAPLYLHLLVALLLGLAMPAGFAALLAEAARIPG